MIIDNGTLTQARQLPSPNFNDRPAGVQISLLVIHNISLPPGEFAGDWVEKFFQNQLDGREHPYFQTIANLKVSAHCYIRRSGEIVQFVNFGKRAWHAGRSIFGDEPECNDYSIGVELEGTDTAPYTDAQYRVLGALSTSLLHYYPKITKSRIAGHSDIAPGRKSDPGPSFDWDRYLASL